MYLLFLVFVCAIYNNYVFGLKSLRGRELFDHALGIVEKFTHTRIKVE